MKKLFILIKKKNHGFTLIELIVIIGILAILITLAIPGVASYIEGSMAATNESNAKIIYNAGCAYLAANSDATLADVTYLNLTGGNYLDSQPMTAGGIAYGLNTSGTSLKVTWTKETTKDIEGGTLVAKGALAAYPH